MPQSGIIAAVFYNFDQGMILSDQVSFEHIVALNNKKILTIVCLVCMGKPE